jgi:hypothetical protein
VKADMKKSKDLFSQLIKELAGRLFRRGSIAAKWVRWRLGAQTTFGAQVLSRTHPGQNSAFSVAKNSFVPWCLSGEFWNGNFLEEVPMSGYQWPNNAVYNLLLFFLCGWNFGNGDFLFIAEKSIKMKLIMQNKPNFQKSQMFITVISTMNYSEKCKLDTWSKQTQTKPILPAIVGKIALSAPVVSIVEPSRRAESMPEWFF